MLRRPLRLHGHEEGRRRGRTQSHSPPAEGGAALSSGALAALPGHDYVFIARGAALTAPFAELPTQMAEGLARLKSRRASPLATTQPKEQASRAMTRTHQEHAPRRRAVAAVHRPLGLFLRFPADGQAAPGAVEQQQREQDSQARRAREAVAAAQAAASRPQPKTRARRLARKPPHRHRHPIGLRLASR